MKIKRIIAICIIIFFFAMTLFQLKVNNVNAVVDKQTAKEDYTHNYGDYSASFSNFQENKTDIDKLGTVDVKISFKSDIAEKASIPKGWSKGNNYIQATVEQTKFFRFTIKLVTGKSVSVYLLAPAKLKIGQKIQDISLKTFGVNYSFLKLKITSDNPDLVDVTENNKKFTITAKKEGMAVLTGQISMLGMGAYKLTTRIYVEPYLDTLDDWDLTIDKNIRAMRVGDNDEITISAKPKEKANTKWKLEDKFSIDWNMEDESVVSFTKVNGDKNVTSGKIGGAKIKALKSGNTKLTATVKAKDGWKYTFEIPITVDVQEEDNTGGEQQGDSENESGGAGNPQQGDSENESGGAGNPQQGDSENEPGGTGNHQEDSENKQQGSGETENIEKDFAWSVTLNKLKLDMVLGSNEEICINATTDDLKEMMPVKGYWNVQWQIENENIAKCVSDDGKETSSGIGIAGLAKISAIKTGTTKLIIKVKPANYKMESVNFEVPISVIGKEDKEEKEDKENDFKDKYDNKDTVDIVKDENVNSKENRNEDTSLADKIIPQAGGGLIIFVLIGVVMVLAVKAKRNIKKI